MVAKQLLTRASGSIQVSMANSVRLLPTAHKMCDDLFIIKQMGRARETPLNISSKSFNFPGWIIFDIQSFDVRSFLILSFRGCLSRFSHSMLGRFRSVAEFQIRLSRSTYICHSSYQGEISFMLTVLEYIKIQYLANTSASKSSQYPKQKINIAQASGSNMWNISCQFFRFRYP